MDCILPTLGKSALESIVVLTDMKLFFFIISISANASRYVCFHLQGREKKSHIGPANNIREQENAIFALERKKERTREDDNTFWHILRETRVNSNSENTTTTRRSYFWESVVAIRLVLRGRRVAPFLFFFE